MKATETLPPPLSQSRQSEMACERYYRGRYVEWWPPVETAWATRGHEVHGLIARYIRQLVKTEQPSDYTWYDDVAAQLGEEAAEALKAFKETYFLDPMKVLAVEWHLHLDSNFTPMDSEFAVPPPAYEGTLDLVTLLDQQTAVIDDWKSHYQIFEADTFQGKLYSLLLMSLNPQITKVIFRLQFVRYGATREAHYTREDLPKLRKLAHAERLRQFEYHARATADSAAPATPGNQCIYCPLLANGCPMDQVNPRAKMKPEERVAYAIYLIQAKKENDRLLKEACTEQGEISHADQSGQKYTAGFARTISRKYPLDKVFDVLVGRDIDIRPLGLVVGSTELKRVAKKHRDLQEELDAVAQETVSTKFSIGKDDEEE